MKDPVGVFGRRRGFHFVDVPAGAMRISLAARRRMRERIAAFRIMLAEEVRADAPLAGSSVERDRLCRLHRHREVSQIARRKVAGSIGA